MEDIEIRSLRDKQKANLHLSENPAIRKQNTVDDKKILMQPKKKRLAKKLSKMAIFLLSVFLIGGLGGVWLDRIFLPNLLVKYPDLNQYELLKRMNERTTIIRETEEVKISQEEGAAEAIARVRPSVTEVLAKNVKGQFAKIGTGVILTSDGYLITPLKNIYISETVNPEIQVKLKDGNTYEATVISQDTDYNLAILKIDQSNLSVIPYADTDNIRLGEKLIIIDDVIITDIVSKTIDNYIMPGSTDSSFQKRIQIVQNLGQISSGAAVINIEGKLVGVGQEANLIIPIGEIRDYIETGINKQ
jgi:small nuclear ribonucleoprotein (snRNP)-like protein